jgi:hypothetical protein
MLETVVQYGGKEGQYWVPNPLLYSEIALSWKQFRTGHMCIYNFLIRMTDTMTSQNIDLSSWDTLYRLQDELRVRHILWVVAVT